MTYTRKNKGVCSLSTEVTLTDDGVIESTDSSETPATPAA